jgi:acyl transferase domain-containing protein
VTNSDDIAIIGIACIFAKARDVGAYWENILAGVDAITDPPAGWGEDYFRACGSGPAQTCTLRGGYLGELAAFDPLAFGVMPSAVNGAEPEHFIALRVAADALSDAGYSERTFNRERTAVILGRGTYVNRGYGTVFQHAIAVNQTIQILRQLHPEHTPQELETLRTELLDQLPPFNSETAPGLVPSVMCGRIANRLDLMGPAYAVDAACASSLVAIDLASADLRSGKADLALAGGVQVSTTFPIALVFAQLGALSKTGVIRPFHCAADGTLLGEGAGIVVLKRLTDAQREGDRIYALIKGIGTASDGRALGVLAPRVEGEILALRRAYECAGITPDSVSLIEAHGTATPAGDEAELQGLRSVFGGPGGGPPSCALGSVKSMIGHTIPAAGAAGLIKASLALHHKLLPPTLHADAANPLLERTPFYLNGAARPWVSTGRTPRRAGVSAFGFGGINTHAVLEEYRGDQ